MQGVDVSPVNVTTTIPASPSVFLGDIFRGAQSTIPEWKSKELFLLMPVLPLQCGDSWWAGASIRHKRPEWVGVRLQALLRGEPLTQVIGQPVTGDRPVDFHSLLFQGCSRSVFTLVRNHNILLRIVKVIEQCLLREPAWFLWGFWVSAHGAGDRSRLRMDGWIDG